MSGTANFSYRAPTSVTGSAFDAEMAQLLEAIVSVRLRLTVLVYTLFLISKLHSNPLFPLEALASLARIIALLSLALACLGGQYSG